MPSSTSSGPRTAFFQQLKQACVPLSQLAIRSQDKTADSREALKLIELLITLWQDQANIDGSILDDKLADYVFFPLSYILRSRDQWSMRVVEAIVRLLRELIQHGWKVKTSPELFQQLLILLSLIIGGVPGEAAQRDVPEETTLEGFRTLGALIGVVDPSLVSWRQEPSDVEKKTISALGHAVTVMLDVVTEDIAPLIQLEAVQCIRDVFGKVKDNAVLAQFLPGTVSSLGKRLSPPLEKQSQKRVLVSCLETLQLVLTTVLGDLKVRSILKPAEGQTEEVAQTEIATETAASGSPPKLTHSWLKATAAQIKIALSAVLKLRSHDSEDVQNALHRFCIGLLGECHLSLADSQSVLAETALMLEDEDTTQARRLETSLQDLASIYPELADGIKSALYNWVTGLPRVMQSNNERTKQLAIRSILRGSRLAAAMQMDSSMLGDSLGDSLRDSIVTLIKGSKPSKVMVDDLAAVDLSQNTDLVKSGTELATYNPVILDSEGQRTTRREIASLISNVGSSSQQVKLATFMLSHVRDSEGVDQVASYWLAFELLKATYAQTSDMDDMFDLSSLGESKFQDQAFQELYDFSTSVLSAHSDAVETDWRLEAIALEVTAFAASRMKLDFRPELIDVLYPITTFLGSDTPQLRRHSITTLNMLAASCGYSSVSDLIVDNADYMVNSISLRLNTLDISPASTRVLTMMIRLTGPKLIPFLDDVVAAIFAALDNYHGYPVFVESLFSVLSEVVTQGVNSDMVLLEDKSTRPTLNHKKRKPSSTGIPGISEAIDKHLERTKRTKLETDDNTEEITGHPAEPWGPGKSKTPNEAESLLDKLTSTDQPQEEEQEDSSTAVEKPPPTPTYTLLTRILSLTQHYLTSPTPTLRKSLLDLVSTVSPALAPDENAFLPLVHTVWPVVITRLQDPEPYVAIAACKALGALCAGAGDFLGSRFKTEWGDSLAKWVKKVKGDALKARGGSSGRATSSRSSGGAITTGLGVGKKDGELVIPIRSGLSENGGLVLQSTTSSSELQGRFTQASQVWEAALGLLRDIVSYVKVEDEMFDEILGLVVDVLPRHKELREALETVNSDAVWLALYERGGLGEGELPVMEGFEFVRLGVAV
ncbi:armadillo-type protein [Podospora australis]|uniref:Armadillo-type protein n=1 Tax=Podospora australis TaxID=1536484 RepID=A0AAN6WYL1_9PEZI|nr:armadillo-type protein [Podospora australis]